jgi:hypothetical protein
MAKTSGFEGDVFLVFFRDSGLALVIKDGVGANEERGFGD